MCAALGEHKQWNGIDCRFGWAGFNSEAHYDFKRNFVAMLAGWKRWVLLPPSECGKLSLLPWGHPSARHCNLSFFDLDAAATATAAKGGGQSPEQMVAHERLLDAAAFDVNLGPGDVLHVPVSCGSFPPEVPSVSLHVHPDVA